MMAVNRFHKSHALRTLASQVLAPKPQNLQQARTMACLPLKAKHRNSLRWGSQRSLQVSSTSNRNQEYDLCVIGSGPAGQKAAIAAAKLGKRVLIVDKRDWIGGVCVHTGTIPSKTLREAILYLTGFKQRSFYGRNYQTKKDQISVDDLAYRVQTVEQRETEVIWNQLRRNDVDFLSGHGTFIDHHTVCVEKRDGSNIHVHAQNFLISCGTRPAHNPCVPIDGKHIVDGDTIMEGLFHAGGTNILPRRLIVVGAGVIGMEYASMLSSFDHVDVTLLDQRDTVLPFVDREIIETLMYHMRKEGTKFMMGEQVNRVEVVNHGVKAFLDSGKQVQADALLYCVGRQSNADRIGLENVGIETDDRGYLSVNEKFQTEVPHIYAGGDVIGFPALASTSWEQGRLAAQFMFAEDGHTGELYQPDLLPYGIYTIPEISTVGKSEAELTKLKIPYVVGRASYRELAKGQMVGDEEGLLKLLFCPQTKKLLGVHVIGESAAEIVHIGLMGLATNATIDVFQNTVFNYPTLAEAYKVAALDGLNQIATTWPHIKPSNPDSDDIDEED